MKTSAYSFIFIALLATSCIDYYPELRNEAERVSGYYDVEEYSRTFDEFVHYEMYIARDNYSSHEVYLNDIYSNNTRVYARVNNDMITIPRQVSNGFEFEGSGRVFRGRLELDYRVIDLHSNTPPDYIEATAFRD